MYGALRSEKALAVLHLRDGAVKQVLKARSTHIPSFDYY